MSGLHPGPVDVHVQAGTGRRSSAYSSERSGRARGRLRAGGHSYLVFDIGHAGVVEQLDAPDVDHARLRGQEQEVDHLARRPHEPIQRVNGDELAAVLRKRRRQALPFQDTKTCYIDSGKYGT